LQLQRLIPGSGNICEKRDASIFALESVDINTGMDGAWFDTTWYFLPVDYCHRTAMVKLAKWCFCIGGWI